MEYVHARNNKQCLKWVKPSHMRSVLLCKLSSAAEAKKLKAGGLNAREAGYQTEQKQSGALQSASQTEAEQACKRCNGPRQGALQDGLRSHQSLPDRTAASNP